MSRCRFGVNHGLHFFLLNELNFMNMKKIYALLAVLCLSLVPSLLSAQESFKVTSVPPELHFDAYYTKYVDAGGFPVVASSKVRDEALIKAAQIVGGMLVKSPDIAAYMKSKGCKVMIIGEKEETLDLPEYRWLGKTEKDRVFWNKRARGFGGAPEDSLSSSCGEENLICLPSDRYVGENILVHEFSHIVHLVGIVGLHPEFNDELQKLYDHAKATGLWAKTYALENKEEYFAETVQSFFNCNRWSAEPNGVHNSINRREKLKQYDPEMYKLLARFFPEDANLPLCNVIHE